MSRRQLKFWWLAGYTACHLPIPDFICNDPIWRHNLEFKFSLWLCFFTLLIMKMVWKLTLCHMEVFAFSLSSMKIFMNYVDKWHYGFKINICQWWLVFLTFSIKKIGTFFKAHGNLDYWRYREQCGPNYMTMLHQLNEAKLLMKL